jgi:hypothetical protein
MVSVGVLRARTERCANRGQARVPAHAGSASGSLRNTARSNAITPGDGCVFRIDFVRGFYVAVIREFGCKLLLIVETYWLDSFFAMRFPIKKLS